MFTSVSDGGTGWEELKTLGGKRVIYFDYDAPELTSDLLNTGLIAVYADLRGYNPVIWEDGQISDLPITLMYDFSGVTNIDNWDYRATEGSIRITFQNNVDAFTATGISNTHSFRYLVIPANIPAKGNLPDLTNYHKTMEFYGIEP